MKRGLGAAGIALLCTFLLIYAPLLVPGLRGAGSLAAVRAVSILILLLLVRVVLAPLLARTPADLGLAVSPRTAVRFVVGCAVGAGTLLLAFCVAWGAGGFTVAPGSDSRGWAAVLQDLGLFLVGALFEELCFRVCLVGVLRTFVRPALAIGASAAVFGLLHASNPGATTLAVTNTMLAGVLLGVLFLERKGAPLVPSLGLCTGFHFAWNATQSELLGIPVSGFIAHARALMVEPVDLAWSGGSYGLEAGWGATVALAVTCVLYARTANLSTPSWAASPT